MESRNYKRILKFFLLFIFILLVYDLFFEVERRQEVTSIRNFPRYSRLLLMFFYAYFVITIKSLSNLRFNRIFIYINYLIIFHVLFGGVFNFEAAISLVKILYVFLSYLFFIKIFSILPLSSKKYLKTFVVCSIFTLSTFIIVNRIGSTSGLIKYYGDNNSYILLNFLPFLFLLDFKRKNLFLAIIFIAMLFSLKRGAIFVLLISILPYIFYNSDFKNSALNRIRKIVFVFFVIVLSFSFFNSFNEIILSRVLDLSNSDFESFGSGRGLMYFLILEDWFSSNQITTYLFGFGYNSVQDFFLKAFGNGLMAHSDFLNFLHSYGVLGLSFLFWFVSHQIKIVRNLFRKKSKLFLPYYVLFVNFFLKALYSGNFEQANFVYTLMGFAFINSLILRQQKISKNQ